MEKTIGMAVIGCGARGRCVGGTFIRVSGGRLAPAVVYDPRDEAVEAARREWGCAGFRRAASMEEAVNAPDVDFVLIATPNACHCEAAVAALAAGKQVFSEKPLATTLEDCERIIEAEKRSGIKMFTGFVLRYSPLYRKVKELLDSGTFGDIISISACENRESYGGGASMSSDLGWRRFRSQSGPYLLEKCSHDLDLLNWYAGCTPSRVAAFCGLDLFVPKNAALWDSLDRETFAAWVPPEHRINPFTSPKDIYDNHAVIMEYPNGVRMCFQLTLANAIPERRMYISCTLGTIIAECFTGILRCRCYGEECESVYNFAGGGHGGGDQCMEKEILEALLNGGCGGVSGSANGFDCARVALAADLSARTGKVVTL